MNKLIVNESSVRFRLVDVKFRNDFMAVVSLRVHFPSEYQREDGQLHIRRLRHAQIQRVTPLDSSVSAM